MSVGALATMSVAWSRRTYPADGGAATITPMGTLRARVQPIGASERRQYEGELASVSHRLYVEGSPTVRASDYLTLSDPDRTVLIVRGARDVDMLGRFVTIHAEQQS